MDLLSLHSLRLVGSVCLCTALAAFLPRLWRHFRLWWFLRRIPTPRDSSGALEFQGDCPTLLRKGFSESPHVIRVKTRSGHVVVLSPHLARSINAEQYVSPGKFTQRELYGDVPGLEPFRFASTHRGLMRDVISTRLNRSFEPAARYLSIEVADALRVQWADSAEFHQIPLGPTLLQIVAQGSLRAFLGPDLCRNSEMLRIATEYATTAMAGVSALRSVPRMLIPFVHWFMPDVQRSRALLKAARNILDPELDKLRRQNAAETGQRQGADSLAWFEDVAKGRPYDPVVAQMAFAVAAIHSTTDFLTRCLADLALRPDLVRRLRAEIISTLSNHGWQSGTFSRMTLLDSTMKESQRLKPISLAFMKSEALKDLHLADGTMIPKGAHLAVSAHSMTDPHVYHQPLHFRGDRFLQPAEAIETRHFSSTSPDHMGFGFGKHACPGRFFVTLEIKIILVHILLKYDFNVSSTRKPPGVLRSGFDQVMDPTATIEIRRRKEEIDFGKL